MLAKNETGFVELQIQNQIATLTFAHPASNSFPSALLQEFASQVEVAGHNPMVRVLVVQSLGNQVFCAGASFDELLRLETLEESTLFFSGFARVINALRTCPKLVIGRIQGKAVGGGVGLIAACDYALATTESSVKLSELAIGIGAFVIEPAVSRKIGRTAFAQLSLEAHQWKTASWALEKGLYAHTYASLLELDQAVAEMSKKLAGYSPEALFEIKKLFWNDAAHWDDLLLERAAISGKLALSTYCKNALKAFKV